MNNGFVKRTEAGKRGSGEAEIFCFAVQKNKRRDGFTIIELLIAIAILSIIMSVLYKSFTASTEGIKRAETVDDINSTVRVIFLKLMDDINSAYLDKNNKNTKFVGDSKRDKELPQDSLSLTSLSNLRMIKDAKETDLHEIGYYLKEDYNYQRQEKKLSLFRREKKTIGVEPVLEGGETYELTDEIAGIGFNYYDGATWKDKWDSRITKTLPNAVEVEIILFDADKNKRRFKTIIDVPMGK